MITPLGVLLVIVQASLYIQQQNGLRHPILQRRVFLAADQGIKDISKGLLGANTFELHKLGNGDVATALLAPSPTRTFQSSRLAPETRPSAAQGISKAISHESSTTRELPKTIGPAEASLQKTSQNSQVQNRKLFYHNNLDITQSDAFSGRAYASPPRDTMIRESPANKPNFDQDLDPCMSSAGTDSSGCIRRLAPHRIEDPKTREQPLIHHDNEKGEDWQKSEADGLDQSHRTAAGSSWTERVRKSYASSVEVLRAAWHSDSQQEYMVGKPILRGGQRIIWAMGRSARGVVVLGEKGVTLVYKGAKVTAKVARASVILTALGAYHVTLFTLTLTRDLVIVTSLTTVLVATSLVYAVWLTVSGTVSLIWLGGKAVAERSAALF
ncbi:hypothetical protein DFH28DRAFT_894279 [Melampsora americana]|nr:hypothetical protein DFH28DRAFT_894279 [Melampsora americana]